MEPPQLLLEGGELVGVVGAFTASVQEALGQGICHAPAVVGDEPHTGECLDDDTMAAYLRRALSASDERVVEAHLRQCASCRGIVADVAEVSVTTGLAETKRAEGDGRSPDRPGTGDVAADADRDVAAGSAIGRYIVVRWIAAGGFGTVYAAYDPKLDRRVALKVLHARAGSSDGSDAEPRMLREAQAMARLSHPNVTAVYDVMTWQDRICIAMELIDGTDARSWLAETPRSQTEVLEVFEQAGRGLAAAHEAGLVHRDFKPANVLIGKDGRVSVTDFGLARSGRETRRSPQPDHGERPADVPEPFLDVSMTRAGALVGTPRYMAPEQLRGEAATARSDQFSFCVAVWDALHKEHPYGDPLQLDRALRDGEHPRPSSSPNLPTWIRDPLLRGLDVDASRRHPSMEPLLRALSPGRRRGRRRRVVLGIGIAIAAMLPAAWMYDRNRTQAEACTGATDKVDGVFGASRQSELATVFESSGLPYAQTSWATARDDLTRHLDQWSTQYTEACRATLRGEQSPEVLTARMSCLDQALDEVDFLLDELTQGNEPQLRNAVHAIGSLGDVRRCEDVESLLTQIPATPEERSLAAGIRTTLARARAMAIAGNAAESFALGQAAVERARALAYPPVLAEALLQLGRSLTVAGTPAQAEDAFREAILEANRGRHDRAAAEAWIDLLFVVGTNERGSPTAHDLEHASAAALQRLKEAPALEARRATAVGLIHARAGRYPQALQAQRAAVTLIEREHGPAAAQLGVQLHRVAELLVELERFDEAGPEAQRSRDIIARTLGPQHPRLALPVTVLAQCACADGDHEACITLAEEAANLRLGARGTNEVALLPIMLTHARGLAGAGRTKEAMRTLEAARQVAVDDVGEDSVWAGLIAAEMARVLARSGPRQDAVAMAQTAVDVLERALGPDHPDVERARQAHAGLQDSSEATAEKK
jgi:tetratricopeptide (TPR) repeat protein